jgi:hypothetical protein
MWDYDHSRMLLLTMVVVVGGLLMMVKVLVDKKNKDFCVFGRHGVEMVVTVVKRWWVVDDYRGLADNNTAMNMFMKRTMK